MDNKIPLDNNNRYAAIDIGVNNLAAIGSNGMNPILINGKPLKSINQYYNKQIAKLTSILETRNKQKTSRRKQAITLKRNNKIKDYLHKASTYIINQLVANSINTLVIGENKEWKQEVNMSTRNNQNFVQVPFDKFKSMLKYKAEIAGMHIIMQEESYTSKASFLNGDHIPVYKKGLEKLKFSGYREKRGLYKLKGQKKYINADINGAFNILSKAVGIGYSDISDLIEVCSMPLLISIKFN